MDPYDEDPSFRPRRNPARLWTLLAVAAAVLMLAAALAVYYWGMPGLGAGASATTADSSIRIDVEANRQQLASGYEALFLNGQLRNVTGTTQRLNRMQAQLLGPNDRVVHSWLIAPPVGELGPAQTVPFSAMEMNVPPGANNVTVTVDSSAVAATQTAVN